MLADTMTQSQASAPWPLKRVELWLLALMVVICLVLTISAKDRRQRRAVDDFLRRAPVITQALERFAAAHGGAFPPDAMYSGPPPGLDAKYLAWDPDWLIDYEVHPNGQGGHYVCLEFAGPLGEFRYHGLCNQASYRRLYGQGQKIPGQVNRVWLIREQAPILEKK